MSPPSSIFVVAYRRAGAEYPAAFPPGVQIVDFQHDGQGGTTTLYNFPDADDAANFAALVEGNTFTSKRKATHAYREAIGVCE